MKAIRDMNILASYRGEKEFEAEDGHPGGERSREGKNGKDFFLNVPIGTIITNLSNNKKYTLDTEGQEILVLEGGNGGYGNEYFKSSRNTTPKETTPGKDGEDADFLIEIELIADVGFVGFPNAGKSSLLNALTNSQSKVGAYQFTTLDPHLGMLHGYVLADIPGIIEGASEGKGLGYKFLRHIKKTRAIVHLISVENENVVEAYKSIRKELGEYNKDMLEKKEIVILSKIDEVGEEEVSRKKKELEDIGLMVETVTVLDDDNLKDFSDFLTKELAQ